jgi:hypothetical protein
LLLPAVGQRHITQFSGRAARVTKFAVDAAVAYGLGSAAAMTARR